MINSKRLDILIERNPDLFGSIASTMCMLHCIATPFIFIIPTSKVSCGEAGPWWWHTLDFIFLLLGFIAIRMTHHNSSLKWMTNAMYGSWLLLVLIIVNAKTSIIPIPEMTLYILGICLVGLHLYNLIYSKSENNECCVE